MFCGVTATSVKRPGPSSAGSGMDARTRPEMSCSLCSVDERERLDELTTQRSPSAESNLERRDLVEARVDAGEARHTS